VIYEFWRHVIHSTRHGEWCTRCSSWVYWALSSLATGKSVIVRRRHV